MSVDKRNIFLENVTEPLVYKSSSHPITKHYPERANVSYHASYLKNKFEQCRQQDITQKQVAAIKYKNGTYLEFAGEKGYELATKSLENRPQGIRLLNVRTDSDGTIKATVYVPEGKMSYFLKKIEVYATEKTPKGKPKNEELIGSIEDVRLAALESFWLDKIEELPKEIPVRCEVWLRYEVKTRGKNIDYHPERTIDSLFMESCKQLEIEVDKKSIYFPERVVKLVTANGEQLKNLLTSVEYITEIRRAEEPNSFFEELSVAEQKEWVQDVMDRTTFEKSGVSICILDAGINSEHPLLAPAIDAQGVQTLKEEWGVGDNANYRGHGTEMAGVALYNDLKDVLLQKEEIVIAHEIESVKILPPIGENPRNLYGALTQQAVSLAEIARPSNSRIMCMAVTSNDSSDNDGRPTSWSAALDNITSGADEEGEEKRLFIVSVGNVEPHELTNATYPNSNIIHPVENPAQSWNAISVGAYCKSVEIQDSAFKSFNPVAGVSQLSPYSATSMAWSSKWPIKPEVLFDGGNMVTNGLDIDSCPDVSLLTTGHRVNSNLFSVIWGTSSATAQASNFCARLKSEYPDMWSETVRALMVHSAEWTAEMKQQFCADESKKRERRNLLRTCGYGIPDLNSAIQCMNNSVNMIIQSELQPYNKTSMNEMHLHKIPWPKEVLRNLEDVEVKLKVTLSYYIEPSPGEVGWKDRYRYPSCGLRFEVNNHNQNYEDFARSINVLMREDEENLEGTSGSSRWYLGQSRNCGSIHSDFIIENAVDLCECNFIAVYPIGGWWKERTYLGKSECKVRYSLIVSISTPDINVDLYTPIINQIQNPIEVSIPV